jgi:16S rRNA (guanine966-N2)-methyltransferase
MRVIAGSAKRLQLKTVPGFETRPTTDRIKETLFNMIAPWIPGSSFLDLFAGSGGIGIEALSRGAEEAVFVEKNPKAVSCIKDNLAHTKLDKNASVIASDVLSALSRLNEHKKFDYIFMDPPYDQLLEKSVLEFLSNSDLLSDNAVIIVESSLETELDYLEELGFSMIKEKEYKTNKHTFIERI